jgi:MerR family transcriptional regulator, thiopeptide resistance regulator
MPEAQLSPAEITRRLGVSAKALRLYERHGLLAPIRAQNGWRTYGTRELARLHQILALKRLGLPLKQISALFRHEIPLGGVLAVQEQALQHDLAQAERALALIRAARNKLAAGLALSIDDLATLTMETTMTTQPTDAERKDLMQQLIAKHFTPEERARLAAIKYDQAAVSERWDTLVAEAKALMAKGVHDSPEAMDLARRWQAQVEKFTQGDPATDAKVRQVWQDAHADPKLAADMTMTPDLMAFVGRAMAALKARG